MNVYRYCSSVTTVPATTATTIPIPSIIVDIMPEML
jgi:hypothetical protein